ncbi:hypothetical protein [Streptomyces hainanensis]|uniref:hypothetical protein n=1 Tax=Streptomyces hainanensis TaxID=402648 RepID=UPI001404E87C|nr:hypothetical protein [Streptomyces hainanensis]
MTDDPIRVAPRTVGAHRTIAEALAVAPAGAVISIATAGFTIGVRPFAVWPGRGVRQPADEEGSRHGRRQGRLLRSAVP